MNLQKLFIFTLVIYLFTGCSYKNIEENIDMSNNDAKSTFRSASLENTINKKDLRYSQYKKSNKNLKTQNNSKTFDSYSNSNNITSKNTLNEELYDFYTQWEGVKYKLGGESKSGIDCSAFIKKAFEEKLNLEMPRTTTLQSQVGKEINKNELEVGDLVFFRTGRSRHVGIYIEDGNFMHASTSNGVTISNLDNSYFNKNYWKAQRIID
ncbi:MAG: C40 family peptidase [Aliarcobacter sp.]|nr:C40 family peptidase [Aliarcobacter sp.]